MHINCSICDDQISQAENMCCTPCGHVYHHRCLMEWMERSESCPQCRYIVTENSIKRVYFNVASRNSIEENASKATPPQLKLDDVVGFLFQLNKDLKVKEEKMIKLEDLLKDERQTHEGTKKQLADKETAIAELKEQLKYVKIQNRETERLRTENKTLNKTLSELKEALEKAERQKEESKSKLQALQTEQASKENIILNELENVSKKIKETLISKNEPKIKTVKLKRKSSESDNSLVIVDKAPPTKIYKHNAPRPPIEPCTSTESRDTDTDTHTYTDTDTDTHTDMDTDTDTD